MANTTFFNVPKDESIHAETHDTGNVPTIYALNASKNGKGAAVDAVAMGTGAAVWAISENGEGVHAETNNKSQLPALSALTKQGKGAAIYATAENQGIGIHAKAIEREAILAETGNNEQDNGHAAISAFNYSSHGNGPAIYAKTYSEGTGITAVANSGTGIDVVSAKGIGLFAKAQTGNNPAISAINIYKSVTTRGPLLEKGSAVFAQNFSAAPTIHAHSAKGKTAGYFNGDVEITQKIIVGGKDLMKILADYETRIASLEGR